MVPDLVLPHGLPDASEEVHQGGGLVHLQEEWIQGGGGQDSGVEHHQVQGLGEGHKEAHLRRGEGEGEVEPAGPPTAPPHQLLHDEAAGEEEEVGSLQHRHLRLLHLQHVHGSGNATAPPSQFINVQSPLIVGDKDKKAKSKTKIFTPLELFNGLNIKSAA